MRGVLWQGLQAQARRLFQLAASYERSTRHPNVERQGMREPGVLSTAVSTGATHDHARLNRVPSRCRQYSTRQ